MAIKKLFKSKSKLHGSDRKTKLAAPQRHIESFVLLVAFSTGFSTISDVQTPPPTILSGSRIKDKHSLLRLLLCIAIY